MDDMIQKADLSKLLNDIRSELHAYNNKYGVKVRLILMEWQRDKSGQYTIGQMRAQNHEDAFKHGPKRVN